MSWTLRAALAVSGFAALLACGMSKSEISAEPEEFPVAHITIGEPENGGSISELIFGVGIEWTEYGNRIFDPQKGALRQNIVELLQPLRIPLWRFPGGILSDYYEWRDGIGPRQNRPKRLNPMDGSEHENSFGTDEFISLCRALQSQALVTANFGTGNLPDAIAWRDYFAKQGFPVRYWEIGNEIYLAEPREHASVPGNDRRIFKTPRAYAEGYTQWRTALRNGVPGTLVGAIAGTYNTSSQNRNWLAALAEAPGREIDFVSLHNSFAPLILGSYDFTNPAKRNAAYRAMYSQTAQTAEDIRYVQSTLHKPDGTPVPVAVTEHFPLFGAGGSQKQMLMILDQSRTVAAAMYTASLLQTYMREHVLLANYNIATSKWFGALVTDTDQGLVRTPTWQVYGLYRNHFGNRLVQTKVDGPTYATRQVGTVPARKDVPFLDVVASRDSENSLYLAVINRHESKAIRGAIDGAKPDGATDVWTVSAPSANSINGSGLSSSTESGPENRCEARRSVGPGNGTYSFSPTSLTIIKWSAAQKAQGRS